MVKHTKFSNLSLPKRHICGARHPSLFFFCFKIRPCQSWSPLCKRMALGDRDHVQQQLFPDKASIHRPHSSAIVDFQFHSAECGRLPLWGWVAKWFSWEKDPEWESARQSALSLVEMKASPSLQVQFYSKELIQQMSQEAEQFLFLHITPVPRAQLLLLLLGLLLG